MTNNPISVHDLIIVAYAERLTPSLLPRVVRPIYHVSAKPDSPPTDLDQIALDLVCEAGLEPGDIVTPQELDLLIEREHATRVEPPITAQPGHVLWIDPDFKPNYGPKAEVVGHLMSWADEHAHQAFEEVCAGHYDKALELTQTALAADEQCNIAIIVAALAESELGHDEYVELLRENAEVACPGVDFERALGQYRKQLEGRRKLAGYTSTYLGFDVRGKLYDEGLVGIPQRQNYEDELCEANKVESFQ
ncbi:MAG: hypothetical protein KAY37_11005 [Phycisphaerae bacterium]|nr:hypothetical protein [Phycisphaerae bacterium]